MKMIMDYLLLNCLFITYLSFIYSWTHHVIPKNPQISHFQRLNFFDKSMTNRYNDKIMNTNSITRTYSHQRLFMQMDKVTGIVISSNDDITTSSSQLIKKKILSSISVDNQSSDSDIYACPESLQPLKKIQRFYGVSKKTYFESISTLNDDNYRNSNTYTYPIIPCQYYDLTIPEEVNRPIYQQSIREIFNTNFFQTTLISSIYERGYRQNFVNFGFPGIDKEFDEASDFFHSKTISNNSTDTPVLLDLSCGSGFMTRKFIKSNETYRIISADFSPSMLKQTRKLIRRENLPIPELVRCDSARLPFRDASIDFIHAGAAMHCWPRVEVALREIYRVLKPGGLFYTTTILNSVTGEQISNNSIISSNTPFNQFPSVQYLEDLLQKAGFQGEQGNVRGRQEGRGCAVLKASKF